jgi:hypothetical protein
MKAWSYGINSLLSDLRGQRSEVRCQRGVGRRQITSAKDLRVYQKAYTLTMEIFELRPLNSLSV